MADGFNPLRWRCTKDGCFNILRRPKIEVFADCFPRRINFGDLDGIVELNGRFCILEWKGSGGTIAVGQKRLFARFTSVIGNVVFVVCGDAETMTITGYSFFWAGVQHPFIKSGLDGLKERVRKWACLAETRL